MAAGSCVGWAVEGVREGPAGIVDGGWLSNSPSHTHFSPLRFGLRRYVFVVVAATVAQLLIPHTALAPFEVVIICPQDGVAVDRDEPGARSAMNSWYCESIVRLWLVIMVATSRFSKTT